MNLKLNTLWSMFTMTSLLTPALAAESQESQKPNVLFIFVDDMTFNGLNVLGNKAIISPNFDELLSEGVIFNNAYNMGAWNGAVSVASRSQLITGQYVWNSYNSEKNGYAKNLQQKAIWPTVMKNAGYNTFQTGKWHIKHISPSDVFDNVGTERPGMPKSSPTSNPTAYNRPLSTEDNDWIPWDTAQGGYWEGGKHWSEVLADETISFLNDNKKNEKPFFAYCAFNAPHDPRQSPQEYVDMYDVNEIVLPESYQPQHPCCNQMLAGYDCRDEQLAPFPRTEYAIQKHTQEYYAIITHLDEQVGRIIDTLKDNDMYDNTLIVFAADNGLAMGKHGLLGKQSLYEHSTKVPLAFVGPGIPKGEVRDQLVYVQDLVPTVYDYIGVETPKIVQFKSALPIVKDDNAKGYPQVYAGFSSTQRMIRDKQYKLYFIPSSQEIMLFDVVNDPQEMNNLYGDKKYDKLVKSLAKKYQVLAKKSGDSFDLTPYYYDLFSQLNE